jgi:hypothetical protein
MKREQKKALMATGPIEDGFKAVDNTPVEADKTYASGFELLRKAQADRCSFFLQVIIGDTVHTSGSLTRTEMHELAKEMMIEAITMFLTPDPVPGDGLPSGAEGANKP